MKSMKSKTELKTDITIIFAGDSGDGIQLTGAQFTNTAALLGNDISTFPNFPAEIRAPQGSLAGVSGFQLRFGSIEIFTPGDSADVLVVMNAAALKANLPQLKKGGTILADAEGFDLKNLKLAKYPEGINPLKDGSLDQFKLYELNISKLTRNALEGSGLGTKEIDRSKNMFVLGFIYWLYTRDIENSLEYIKEKFKTSPALIEANSKVLKAGYYFGETSESIFSRVEVKAAKLEKGTYRNITGNQASALGLLASAHKSGLKLFYSGYPITPASDILHELAKNKNFGVKTFQAEDEIAAISAAIGASFGGSLGVTASSGPGIALKAEAIGLALMLEIPLLIINVQRGGPSTGLPTKTEQSDLLQAIHGRNGEAPVAVIAASGPADSFDTIVEAVRIAIEHMTPVFFLSDGYIANGSEPWKFPTIEEVAEIKTSFARQRSSEDPKFLPYKRNEKLVREWAIPGTAGLEHRVGGLEKENETGNISYDPDNHELMVKLREEKIASIASYIPLQKIDSGANSGNLLILGWGSTYGAIKTATLKAIGQGYKVSHAHIRYLNPLPLNLGDLLIRFDQVLIPELNNGQLIKLIREKYLIPAIGLNKIKGLPFTTEEIYTKIKQLSTQRSEKQVSIQG